MIGSASGPIRRRLASWIARLATAQLQRIQTVFGENPIRLITIKTQRLLYLPALILLLASFAHPATPTKKFEAGKKAKVTGTIVSRNGDLVTVKVKKEAHQRSSTSLTTPKLNAKNHSGSAEPIWMSPPCFRV